MLCSWKFTLKYKHKYPILNARGSSTKDCCKGNIHLKSSFQFTFNRKLEMSLGNNDNNKKLIPEWTQAYLMISTNLLKTAYLKGKIPFWNINIQNVNPVKKNSNSFHFISSGVYPLMSPSHPLSPVWDSRWWGSPRGEGCVWLGPVYWTHSHSFVLFSCVIINQSLDLSGPQLSPL